MSTSEIRSEAAESLGPRRGDDDGRTPNGKVLGVFNEELIFHGEKIFIHNQWEIHDYKSWFHMFSWDFIGFMVMNRDSTNRHGDIV